MKLKMKMFRPLTGVGAEIETTANKWLEENRNIEVLFMTQSPTAGSDDLEPTVTILYQDVPVGSSSGRF